VCFPLPKLSHWPEYLFILLVAVCPWVAATWLFDGSILWAIARYAGATVAGLILWVGIFWLVSAGWRS
jgi:hypothetical protein